MSRRLRDAFALLAAAILLPLYALLLAPLAAAIFIAARLSKISPLWGEEPA
ncbi:hypothetical protein [Caulobacter sp. 17J80-11]|uniref:hypothetical protein n=1 Tax=Caulobacter sp. 17J80-11 TaxID=2763502 RepID=UPI001653752C|nr:hypothetical protein [Caulobacter sp. 17J80-11]MBC6982483.1 hypothetical protein [Caulobacter sp. 17J80-11]